MRDTPLRRALAGALAAALLAAPVGSALAASRNMEEASIVGSASTSTCAACSSRPTIQLWPAKTP